MCIYFILLKKSFWETQNPAVPRSLLPEALAVVGRRVVCLPLVLEHEMMRTWTAPSTWPSRCSVTKCWRTDKEAGRCPNGKLLASCRGHWQTKAQGEPSMHGVSKKRRGGWYSISLQLKQHLGTRQAE